jgi:hypothetical protein
MDSHLPWKVVSLVSVAWFSLLYCVTDARRECPASSSRALMNLASVLDRRSIFSAALKRAVA